MTEATNRDSGMTLGRAALVAGLGLLVMVFAAPFAELYVFPKLFASSDIEVTVRNITENRGLFVAGFMGYLITFILDVVVAWALYVLLAPVNRSLSLLTAWFRLVYTGMAIVGLLKLATLFRLLNSPSYLEAVAVETLHSQVRLLWRAFGYEWGLGLVFFGIHLALLGILVYRSGYIPRLLGILLGIAGLGYLSTYLGPYLYPKLDLGWLVVTYASEVVFMVWLLVWGRRLPEPASRT